VAVTLTEKIVNEYIRDVEMVLIRSNNIEYLYYLANASPNLCMVYT